MTPTSTAHLLWARPVSQISLFLSIHTYTALLPALHAFRLCHQYGNSNSFLLPPVSRLPPCVATCIERYLIAAYRREIQKSWIHRLKTTSPCERCLPAPATREEELRKQICHCRTVFKRDLQAQIREFIVGGKDIWDGGDVWRKMTTGVVLRKFCGLDLFVEDSDAIGDKLWLCLPPETKGEDNENGDKGKSRLCVGKRYVQLMDNMVQRFRFAVETLGMEGDIKELRSSGKKRLEHWGIPGSEEGTTDENFGVNLMLFSAGFMAA